MRLFRLYSARPGRIKKKNSSENVFAQGKTGML